MRVVEAKDKRPLQKDKNLRLRSTSDHRYRSRSQGSRVGKSGSMRRQSSERGMLQESGGGLVGRLLVVGHSGKSSRAKWAKRRSKRAYFFSL